jgi:hypothetical protein
LDTGYSAGRSATEFEFLSLSLSSLSLSPHLFFLKTNPFLPLSPAKCTKSARFFDLDSKAVSGRVAFVYNLKKEDETKTFREAEDALSKNGGRGKDSREGGYWY